MPQKKKKHDRQCECIARRLNITKLNKNRKGNRKLFPSFEEWHQPGLRSTLFATENVGHVMGANT